MKRTLTQTFTDILQPHLGGAIATPLTVQKLIAAVSERDEFVLGEPCISCHNNEQDNPNNWCELYAKWVEQSERQKETL